jgi:hypothetical protein
MQSAGSQEDSARKPLTLCHERRIATRRGDERAAARDDFKSMVVACRTRAAL